MSNPIKKAASKVKSTGDKVVGAIKPLGIALPVAAPNITALFSGGPRALVNYNVQQVKAWRPPDWNTVNAYVDGPGGMALMTSFSAKLAKWGIKVLGFSSEAGALIMLIDAVDAWGEGSAVGFAVKEIIYPSAAAGGGVLGGISFGGNLFGGQPATGSKQEMATKDKKPKRRIMWS
jgi:hypothetical protein